jgi:hypothetical protein
MGVQERARDADGEREWIPREIEDAPPYLLARRDTAAELARRGLRKPRPKRRAKNRRGRAQAQKLEAADPFEQSRSLLREALDGLDGATTRDPELAHRIRRAKERHGELEQMLHEAEQRVTRALGAVDRDAGEVRQIFNRNR